MMKRKFVYVLMLGMIIGMLTACGGENAKEQAEASATNNSYTFCNDQYLYYVPGAGELIERRLSDGSEKKIELESIKNICYVDNEWVYYIKETEVDSVLSERQVWRAPVDKNGSVNVQSEEMMLEEKAGFSQPEGVWCDGKYVVYVEDKNYKYRQYNIEKKQYESNEWLEKRNDYSGSLVVCKGSAFIDYGDAGLIRKALNSNEIEILEDDASSFYGLMATTEGAFWCHTDNGESEIWQYSESEGKKKIATDSQIRESLKEAGCWKCLLSDRKKHTCMLDNTVLGMFTRDNRLYIQVYITDEEDKSKNSEYVRCYDMVILSKDLNGSDSLRYEKKLTQCLQKEQKNVEAIDKYADYNSVYKIGASEAIYYSKGLCVMMAEDKCLMYLENEKKEKNMWACYDFATEEFRFLTEKDEELYMMYYDRYRTYYNYYLNEEILDMDASAYRDINILLPNNYDL